MHRGKSSDSSASNLQSPSVDDVYDKPTNQPRKKSKEKVHCYAYSDICCSTSLQSPGTSVHLPPIQPAFKPPVRSITLKRTKDGNFGFHICIGRVIERQFWDGDWFRELRRQILLVEPIKEEHRLGLLRGDRLLEVNGTKVDTLRHDDILRIMSQSGDEIVLRVQPIPELMELAMRSSDRDLQMMCQQNVDYQTSFSLALQDARTSPMAQNGNAPKMASSEVPNGALPSVPPPSQHQGQKVWLVHRDIYAGARLIERLPGKGLCRIVLDHDNRQVEVQEEDLELANPEDLDRSENLSSLRHINESSIVHVLRQRFGANLVHTYAGSELLVVNPMAPLQIYTDKVMQLFRDCRQEDMPPHVFATAQMALHALQTTRQSQALCLIGSSGSGKTTSERHVINYILHAAGTVTSGPAPFKRVTVEKLHGVWTLLEAFTCARTLANTNASRCARLTTMELAEGDARVVGIHVQAFLLERTRIVRRPDGEPCFHVFYQLLAGCDAKLRNDLYLTQLDEPNLFMTPLQRPEDRTSAQKIWHRIVKSSALLNISDEEWTAICRVLAAIYHLGGAGAVDSGPSDDYHNNCHFEKPIPAQRAAALLGCSFEQLRRYVFDTNLDANATATTGPKSTETHLKFSALELLEGFVTGLYTELVQVLIYLINRALSSGQRSIHTISVLDAPGFQNTASCGRTSGATFEDLCYNYAQERLLLLSHDKNFTTQRAKYEKENVYASWYEEIETSPADILTLMDRNAESHYPRSRSLGGEGEQKGLLWILDEEALIGSEASFVKRMYNLYRHHKREVKEKSHRVLRRVGKNGNFIMSHCLGSQKVQYNPVAWLKNCREYPTSRNAQTLLKDSQNEVLNELVVRANTAGQTMRRGGRMCTPTLFRQKSVSSQVKQQMDFLVDLLGRSGQVHFIYCLLPVANAGLCELRESPLAPHETGGVGLNVALLRQQIRGLALVPLLRAYKQGFPEQIPFHEFRRRFGVLLSPQDRPSSPVLDEKEAVEELIKKLGLDPSTYKIGLSQVFLRFGVANSLESQRDKSVTGNIVAFQAYCRGYLARKRVQRLRVEHTAIQCIQRNASTYLNLREWSWWRLFARLRPLLQAGHIGEDLQRLSNELEELRAKLAKVEAERDYYREDCERLQSQLDDLKGEVRDEQVTAVQTSNQLEVAEEERLKLQNDLDETKVRLESSNRKKDELEYDLVQMKMWQQQIQRAQYDREHSDEEERMDDETYKERYQSAMREVDFLHRQLQHRENEANETQEYAKRQLEKKLTELMSDNDQLQTELTATKRRLTKVQSELSDTRLQSEEVEARASELERKQRRFDAEMARVTAAQQEEAALREQLQRDRDEALADKFRLEREHQDVRAELTVQCDKSERLFSQLTELTSSGSVGAEAELLNLRRSKIEMEQKVQELQEEVDEESVALDTLQQAKLRAEMALEKLRNQHVRELEERDQELEVLRGSTSRRIRQLETQLEEETIDRQKLVKEKREADRQLSEMLAREPTRDREYERKLKRDLKKKNALLKDAYATLEQHKNIPDDKETIKQLRDQLEESELQKESALRSRRMFEHEKDELQQQIEELQRAKTESDDRGLASAREKMELQSQVEDLEEEVNEVLRKYRAAIAQQTVDSAVLTEHGREVSELMEERDHLRRELAEALSKTSGEMHVDKIDRSEVLKVETRCRDLETRLDMESSGKNRLQTQIDRLKEQLERAQEEKDAVSTAETAEKDRTRRLQRQLREAKDGCEEAELRAQESERRRSEMTGRLEQLEEDYSAVQNDLKTALRRIQDLQSILDEDIQDDSDLDDDERANTLLSRVDDVLKRRSSLNAVPTVAEIQASVAANKPRRFASNPACAIIEGSPFNVANSNNNDSNFDDTVFRANRSSESSDVETDPVSSAPVAYKGGRRSSVL